MMTKEDHIRFWIEQAEDDWSAVDTLREGRKNLHSLFFAHLVIEKLCKALWIKHNLENVPPRTHNLILLLESTPIKLSTEQHEFLLNLNRFQLEGRYPDYMTKMHHICNETFTNDILFRVKSIKVWLQGKLL